MHSITCIKVSKRAPVSFAAVSLLVGALALSACTHKPADSHLRPYINAVVREKQAKVPYALDGGLYIETVGSSGNAIIYGVRSVLNHDELSPKERGELRNKYEEIVPSRLCADKTTETFLKAGGEVHVAVLSQDGKLLAGSKLAGCR